MGLLDGLLGGRLSNQPLVNAITAHYMQPTDESLANVWAQFLKTRVFVATTEDGARAFSRAKSPETAKIPWHGCRERENQDLIACFADNESFDAYAPEGWVKVVVPADQALAFARANKSRGLLLNPGTEEAFSLKSWQHLVHIEKTDDSKKLSDLSLSLRQAGHWDDAEGCLKAAIAVSSKKPGPQHPQTAELSRELAYVFHKQGKDSESEWLYKRALQIYEASGTHALEVAQTAEALGDILKAQNKLAAASPLYEKALSIYDSIPGAKLNSHANMIAIVADVQMAEGQVHNAEQLLKRAATMLEERKHPEFANMLNKLGNLYLNGGRLMDADTTFKRAIAVCEADPKSNPAYYAEASIGLGLLSLEHRRYAEAESTVEKALLIYKNLQDPLKIALAEAHLAQIKKKRESAPAVAETGSKGTLPELTPGQVAASSVYNPARGSTPSMHKSQPVAKKPPPPSLAGFPLADGITLRDFRNFLDQFDKDQTAKGDISQISHPRIIHPDTPGEAPKEPPKDTAHHEHVASIAKELSSPTAITAETTKPGNGQKPQATTPTGDANTGDVPMLTPAHLKTAQPAAGQSLINTGDVAPLTPDQIKAAASSHMSAQFDPDTTPAAAVRPPSASPAPAAAPTPAPAPTPPPAPVPTPAPQPAAPANQSISRQDLRALDRLECDTLPPFTMPANKVRIEELPADQGTKQAAFLADNAAAETDNVDDLSYLLSARAPSTLPGEPLTDVGRLASLISSLEESQPPKSAPPAPPEQPEPPAIPASALQHAMGAAAPKAPPSNLLEPLEPSTTPPAETDEGLDALADLMRPKSHNSLSSPIEAIPVIPPTPAPHSKAAPPSSSYGISASGTFSMKSLGANHLIAATEAAAAKPPDPAPQKNPTPLEPPAPGSIQDMLAKREAANAQTQDRSGDSQPAARPPVNQAASTDSQKIAQANTPPPAVPASSAQSLTDSGDITIDGMPPTEALSALDKAIGMDTGNFRIWNQKGQLLLQLDRLDEAIKCFDKVTALDSKNIDALYSKGLCLFRKQRYEDAVYCYNFVLNLNPRHAECLSDKGECLTKLGRSEQAMTSYDKALMIDPKLTRAWVGKGKALQLISRFADAVEAYSAALELDPTNDAAERGQRLCKSKLDS